MSKYSDRQERLSRVGAYHRRQTDTEVNLLLAFGMAPIVPLLYIEWQILQWLFAS